MISGTERCFPRYIMLSSSSMRLPFGAIPFVKCAFTSITIIFIIIM